MRKSYLELDSALSDWITPQLERCNESIRRTQHGPIARNAELMSNAGKFRSLRERKALALISWYLGDLGIIIREDLRDLLEKQPLQEKMEVSLYLDYKYAALEATLSSMSDDDFFGNYKNLILDLAKRVVAKMQLPKPARNKVRRRGYQDHGCCKPKDKWLPSRDVSLNELHAEIERERKSYQDTQLFLMGLLGVF